MDLCFDFSRCKIFKIYVYPDVKGTIISDLAKKLLTILRKSKYYTDDPNEACLFIPSLDTLHRDALSTNFDRSLNSRIQNLPFWKENGINHLIFNIYAGTWPNYYEDEFHMNVHQSLMVKSSISTLLYRPNFDISFPLVHSTHVVYKKDVNCSYNYLDDHHKKYLLVFKGKRYLQGVGSDSRNFLHFLHNGKDMILVTTCRHGTNWMLFADKNCERDMKEYEKYDYDELMKNSRFCLVPRGRRLGSYRFLEALKAGCIPVMLSNDWVLPFSEVIHWNDAVVWADERLITQVPLILAEISDRKVAQYRARLRFLWLTYFSSVEQIVNTVLEIIKDRMSTIRRNKLSWNVSPGGLSTSVYHMTVLDFLSSSVNNTFC